MHTISTPLFPINYAPGSLVWMSSMLISLHDEVDFEDIIFLVDEWRAASKSSNMLDLSCVSEPLFFFQHLIFSNNFLAQMFTHTPAQQSWEYFSNNPQRIVHIKLSDRSSTDDIRISIWCGEKTMYITHERQSTKTNRSTYCFQYDVVVVLVIVLFSLSVFFFSSDFYSSNKTLVLDVCVSTTNCHFKLICYYKTSREVMLLQPKRTSPGTCSFSCSLAFSCVCFVGWLVGGDLLTPTELPLQIPDWMIGDAGKQVTRVVFVRNKQTSGQMIGRRRQRSHTHMCSHMYIRAHSHIRCMYS